MTCSYNPGGKIVMNEAQSPNVCLFVDAVIFSQVKLSSETSELDFWVPFRFCHKIYSHKQFSTVLICLNE